MRFVPVDVPFAGTRKLGWSPRLASAAAYGVAVALLAVGCGASGTSSAPRIQDRAITVAAEPGVDNAPLYIAKADGLFAKAGLQVTIKKYGSPRQDLAALRSGSAGIAFGDYADFFYSEDVKPGLLAVADGYDAAPGVMEVLSLPHSGIYTPQELAGKTIGTPEPQGVAVRSGVPFRVRRGVPYNLATVATQSVLDNDGVNPALVTWKPMQSQDLIGALKRHQVDAILVMEPYIFQAEQQLGAVEVLDSCSGATASLPLAGYFTLKSFAKENPSALRAFRSALLEAQARAVLTGPVDAVLARYPGMSMQSASLVTVGVYPTSLNAGSLQRVAALMFNFGVLHKFLDVSSMVPSGHGSG
jgi:NitT/TauT family transport system substrate-binding protein